ncbi:hypothetical protein PENSPDRAFT_659758 [Peniophora sp. CONT]|nr:hypothetical protein PENSPDRAFT_659758 [Peniophora sp. CONT]
MAETPPGLFHYVNPPVHTHPRCGYCKKVSRCIDQGRDRWLKLTRCTRCNITQYCSKQCQLRGSERHAWECDVLQDMRRHAEASSGNAHAWTDFTQWLEFHKDSLENAVLAYLISLGSGSELRNLPVIAVAYINNHNLPVQRKFRYTRSGTEDADNTLDFPIAQLDDMAAWMKEWVPPLGNLLPDRGATYMVEVDFGGKKRVPLYRVVQLTRAHLTATDVIPNLQQKIPKLLSQQFSLGQRLKFCCGRVPEFSTCCCGGWTHKGQNEEREVIDAKRVTEKATPGPIEMFILAIVRWCIYPFVVVLTSATKGLELEDPSKLSASTSETNQKVESKEQLSPRSLTSDSGPSDRRDETEPSSVNADKEPTSTVQPVVAGFKSDAIPSSAARKAASAACAPVTVNDAVDTRTHSEINHSPERREDAISNAQLDMVSEPALSFPTDLDASPARDHGSATVIPLPQTAGDAGRPGAPQSRKQKKKSKKGRRQFQLDSAVSDKPSEPSASPSVLISSTGEELPENAAVSHAIKAPGTSTLSVSGYAASRPATPESPASPATKMSEVTLDDDDSASEVRNDALTAEGEGETGQWLPVKSKKEKQHARRKAQKLPETAVTTSIRSHDGRVDTQIDEVPVVQSRPNRTLLDAEINPAPRTSSVCHPPVVLSDTPPRLGAELKPTPLSSTSSMAVSARSTAPRSSVELKPTPNPSTSSVAASVPGKRPWWRRSTSSQKLSTAKPGARSGKPLKSSAPPELQRPTSALGGLHLDNGTSPLTSSSASILHEARAITTTRKPPASGLANRKPTRNRKRRSTSPGTVIPPTVPQQSAYAEQDARHTAARQGIFSEETPDPEAIGVVQEPITLASAHEDIPSDTLTAPENADSSQHSHNIVRERSESSQAPIQPGKCGTSLIPDAPPGLKHPGYTFGSLHFGSEVSPPTLRDLSAGGAQSPTSASAPMKAEHISPEPKADMTDATHQSYEDAEGGASGLQRQVPEPTWPSIQQPAAPDQSYDSEPSGIHQKYILQQQQFYHPPNAYQQQQYQGAAYPPPGLAPPHSHWPYYTTYATQGGPGPYIYSAPYGPYAALYGTIPDPYAQSIYAQQPASAPVPADQDAAQTLKAATEALKAAVRVLEGTSESQDHSGLMEQAYTVLNEAQKKYGDR